MNTWRKIRRVAGFLDDKGLHDAPIRVLVRRATLLRAGLKPEKRGSALKIGLHVIETDERPGIER